jgi:peptidoglycan/LPS O-acetylase OafA/YrhL
MDRWHLRPSSGLRLPAVEGLRAFAACSIVVYHIWRYADPAGTLSLGPFDHVFLQLPLGVTLLFTLSGFLLYRPFAAALLRNEPRPNFVSYLRNRALRILPAYWVILVVTGVILQTTLTRFDLRVGSLASRPTLLLRDALFIQNYSRQSIMTGIGPGWSLAIEVVFYLALPLIVLIGCAIGAIGANHQRRRVVQSSRRLFFSRLAFAGSSSEPSLFADTDPGRGGSTIGIQSSSGASGRRRTSFRSGCC